MVRPFRIIAMSLLLSFMEPGVGVCFFFHYPMSACMYAFDDNDTDLKGDSINAKH